MIEVINYVVSFTLVIAANYPTGLINHFYDAISITNYLGERYG